MAKLFAIWKGPHPHMELLGFVKIHDLGKYNMDACGKAYKMAKEAFPDELLGVAGGAKQEFVDRFKNVLILEEDKKPGVV